MMNAATKSARAAALASLHFDHDVQGAFLLALRDEELNAFPRTERLVAVVGETIAKLFNLEGWWIEEDQITAAMAALSAFGDALDPRRLAA